MRWLVALLIVATALVCAMQVRSLSIGKDSIPSSALAQTYISTPREAPLQLPILNTANGSAFGPERWRGHWSIVFFGFTACPLVCPKTLSILSAVAHTPTSGVASGSTLPVFASIDPVHDTPPRIAAYLSHFDQHIVGLTGSTADVDRFTQEVGAGYKQLGSSFDHSTSLFVIDPNGRLAGILLRPNQPSQIVADLTKLREVYAQSEAH
jgi:protein SCO1/2